MDKQKAMAIINSLTPTMPKDLPMASGIYFISDLAGNVIYAGRSVDLRQAAGNVLCKQVRRGELILRWKLFDKSIFGRHTEVNLFREALGLTGSD